MRTLPARIIRDSSNLLGEGPVWHDGAIWWVDIEAHLLQRLDEDGNYQTWTAGKRIGCAIPCDDGTWLLGMENSLDRLDPVSGEHGPVVRLGHPPGAYRFNDGKCDPWGRLFLGTMTLSAPVMTAAFYRYDGGSSLKELFGQVGTSNGLAWSPDGSLFYYIDSKTGRIDVFDFDAATGTPTNRRPLVAMAPKGRPDGMCIDSEGNLWAGHWDGWAVRCYSGIDGTCLAEIPLPCARVTSCCFGGPDLDRLYITTASHGLPREERYSQPDAGKLFIAEPGVTGAPVPLCRTT